MRDQWDETFGPSEEYEAAAARQRALAAITQRLWDAVTRGDVGQVEAVFTDHPHTVRDVNCFLHAIEQQDAEVVGLFLAKGADPKAPDESYRTPLWVASQAGYDLVVRMLVEAGADPNVLPEDLDPEAEDGIRGESPLLYAALHGDRELIDFLWPRTRPDVREQARIILRARLRLLDESGPESSGEF